MQAGIAKKRLSFREVFIVVATLLLFLLAINRYLDHHRRQIAWGTNSC